MKRILVMYATVEGQSLKVAEYAAHRLVKQGFGARLVDVRDVRYPFALQDYRAVLLVAPVHASFHPREMLHFVSEHREELAKMPVRFLSLSLSEAGVELAGASAAQRARSAGDVQHLTTLLCKATGLAESNVTPIAGSLAYSQYGFLKRMAMRYIAKKAGGSTDTSRDHEYTDFKQVDQAVDKVCEGFVVEYPSESLSPSAASLTEA
jgi:menaquinone-dependent protoporphyrinogen oxidase